MYIQQHGRHKSILCFKLDWSNSDLCYKPLERLISHSFFYNKDRTSFTPHKTTEDEKWHVGEWTDGTGVLMLLYMAN